jgi:hypothetical protein
VPPGNSLIGESIAPALGLRAWSNGAGIVSQAASPKEICAVSLFSLLLSLLLSVCPNVALRRQARREARRRLAPRRLHVELLEDRTVPSAVTVLASHLHTDRGQPEQVRVAETGTLANGNDVTFDAAPGDYHVTSPDGGSTYGTFTVATDGTISGTTGALAASGSTIDFDLSKLAAVTIYGTDLHTDGGLQQAVNVQFFVGLRQNAGGSTDTVYFPAGTVRVTDGIPHGVYGSFTVADNGSGSLVVTGASGAAVATDDHTIHFDRTKLAAVTIYGTDLHTDGGLQQAVNVWGFVGLPQNPLDSTDTVYFPAGTMQVTDAYPLGTYGSFTVADNGSGSLAVTGASGAAVATDDHTIHFDRTKLAAVTIYGTDLKDAGGSQPPVNVRFFVGLSTVTDTGYFPACTIQVTDADGVVVYGTFTVADIGSGVLAVTGTTGRAIATDPYTIHFRPATLQVLIDVKVGNATDPINVAGQGVLPVVLFGGADFDVTQVGLGTVRFAGAAVFQSSLADVNGDGRPDLVLKFRAQDTNLRSLHQQLIADDVNADGVLDSNRQVAQVSLTGQTAEQHFEGSDEVNLFLSGKALRDLLTSLAAAGLI